MRLPKNALVLAVVVAALATVPLRAQAADRREQAISLSAGFGVGFGKVSCHVCSDEPTHEPAPSGFLRIGRAVRADLSVGGALDVWSNTASLPLAFPGGGIPSGSSAGLPGEMVRERVTIASVAAFTQWQPVPLHGFFLTGGLGVGRYQYHSEYSGGTISSRHVHALAYQAGTGFDMRLVRHVSLTPYASVFGFPTIDVGNSIGGERVRESADVVQIGLAFNWH